MKEFAIVKGSVVMYDGDWWKVLEDTGGNLRVEYVHRKETLYGSMPLIQKTIPKSMVEDCRVSINGSFQYQVVKHDKRIDPRRFEFFKEATYTVNAKNVRCSSTRDAIDAVNNGEHLFLNVKKLNGVTKKRLELHNREINLKKKLAAINEYYSNPNLCKTCGKVILWQEGERARTTRLRKYCDVTCQLPVRISNLGA